MAEQNNQNAGNEPGGNQDRTFTQAELDRIVQSRVAEEAKKYADYKEKAEKYDAQLESEKTDLQKATERANNLQKQLDAMKSANAISEIRSKVSKDTSVPVELLTADTEEACKAQADAILKFAKPSGYPGTKSNNTKRSSGSNTDGDDAFREFAREIFNSKGEK